MTILNPESIGDPNATPIVQLTPGLIAMLKPCKEPLADGACNGLQGYHRESCPLATPERTIPFNAGGAA